MFKQNYERDNKMLKGTENIIFQMNNCVCRIYNKGEGTVFFNKNSI